MMKAFPFFYKFTEVLTMSRDSVLRTFGQASPQQSQGLLIDAFHPCREHRI